MALKLTARTREDVLAHIETFLTAHPDISLRQLSAYALGSSEALPRYVKVEGADIKLSAVNAVLTYMEAYTG